ncbi:aminoglycoside 6'-N-acetyltransferase [Senegalia massiliensis]|uniref:aminoglycoside 6'-N-acetyltransferase n=1 Tax=Senegalia massiliensis TaxID=1720316 RepID=UPI00103171AC|nr:aminoglycoside 6'-N-acetyltransferase [Senegalia massiliensis]
MIRTAKIDDLDAVTNLAFSLWPNNEFEKLKDQMKRVLLDKNAAIFLCLIDNKYIGFAQCQLRFDYVEGTESTPVGYLEGIYVHKQYRKQGIAKKFIEQCELWAKENNCIEFGSDCEIANTDSLKFHLKVGFTEANRIICFNKKL